MKKIRLLTTVALLVAMCSTNSTVFAQGNVFDIDVVITNALKNSYDIRMQQYNEQLAENAYEQAKESSDKANERLINIDDMIDLKGKEDKTPAEQAMVDRFQPPSEDERYQLIRNQEIAPLQSEYQLSVAKNNREVAENTLKLNIYTEYSSLMATKDSMDVEQKKFDNLESIFNKSQTQLSLGITSKVEARKNEVNYINEKPILTKQQRQMEISLMSMNKVIGEDLNKKYESFSKDILADTTKIKTLEQYVADALKNRTEVINAEKYVKLKQAEYDLANREYPNGEERYNQQAKYYLDEAQNKLETAKLNIEQEITNSYNDLAKKVKTIEYTKKSYELAKKSYSEYLIRYNLGMISKVDLGSKELSFKQAESNLKSLERGLWISELKLEYQCGKGINATT